MEGRPVYVGSALARKLSLQDQARIVLGVIEGRDVEVTIDGVTYVTTTKPTIKSDK